MMKKEIDFCITGVRYTADRSKIESVEIGLNLEPINGGLKVSKNKRKVSRGFICDLLKTRKLVFYTATRPEEDKPLERGAEVIIYDDKYITTKGNETEKDNLEELPEF